MPKVTFNNAKGILQEAGSGFQVNDAAISTESETLEGNVVITVSPDVIDSADVTDSTVVDITGKYFMIATPDERFYVCFDGGEAGTTDPAPFGLTAANSIRISESHAGDELNTNAKVANAIEARLTDANNGGGLNYSVTATATDGETLVCTAVLGPADDNGDDAAEVADLGADSVNGKFSIANDGAGNLTITVLPIGSVSSAHGTGADVVGHGDLRKLGDGEDDWTVSLSDGTGDNGSALQTFGTSIISNDGGATCTCTLADAVAGTKKLIRQDGAGTITLLLNGPNGDSSSSSFNADEDCLYLISTGIGWGKLYDAGTVNVTAL